MATMNAKSIWDLAIVRTAAWDSIRKVHPRTMAKNPVMFVVEVGSVLTTVALVRDAVFGRWVVFSQARSRRPTDLKSHAPANPSPAAGAGGAPKPSCPFCHGRESECAPEIFRVPATPEPDAASASPWRIRVIENLYPALRRDAEPPAPEEDGEGKGEAAPGERAVVGFGFHDVVIETPRHDVRLWDLDAAGVGDVLLAYARRVRQLMEHPAVKYVQVEKLFLLEF